MTHTTDTGRALLAAVRREPDDDTPRLVYADHLQEEYPETVPCPTCSGYADDPCPRCDGGRVVGCPMCPGHLSVLKKDFLPPMCGCVRCGYQSGFWADLKPCSACDGTGKFPLGHRPARDPASGRHEGGWANCQTCSSATPGRVRSSAHDHAELIRVQCELVTRGATDARPGEGEECYQCYCVRNKRQRTNGPCRCTREVRALRTRERAILAARRHDDRWFPKCVRCQGSPVSVVPGAVGEYEACMACRSTGRIGTYERGCLELVVPHLHDVFESLPITEGDEGRETIRWLTPWGARLRDCHPDVVAVTCADRKPYHKGAGHAWYDPDRPRQHTADPSADVPPLVYHALTGHDTDRRSERYKVYPTPAAAHTALARAVAAVLFGGAPA